MDKKPISFTEFEALCKEAGIESADNGDMEKDYRLGLALADTTEELLSAIQKHPSMRSAHEGYGILKEEFRELEDEVFKRQGGRDIEAMRAEAIQVAAMAIRFVADICHDEAGQN